MSMNITSAQYVSDRLSEENMSIQAVIDGKQYSVPLNLDNIHYAAILEWAKEDGNEIQAAE